MTQASATLVSADQLPASPWEKELFVTERMVLGAVQGPAIRFTQPQEGLLFAGRDEPVTAGLIQEPRNFNPSVVPLRVPAGAGRLLARFGYLTDPIGENQPVADNSGVRVKVFLQSPGSANALGWDYRTNYRGGRQDVDVPIPAGVDTVLISAEPWINDWCANVAWKDLRFAY